VIDDARAEFPIARERAYLFAGAIAPAATPVRAAMQQWIDRWTFDPIYHRTDYYADWGPLREGFAELIGAHASEVAITDNTSRGANLAIASLGLRAGDNVVVDATTYPSAAYPLLAEALGVEVRVVPTGDDGCPLVGEIEPLLDGRTTAVSVSHVCRRTGFRHDLRALASLAHAHGALLLVDAAQSAGALAIDVRGDGVDFLYCGAMKWLLGPPGVGFMFVRSGLEDVPPQIGQIGLDGIGAYPRDLSFSFKPGAQRYEIGIEDLPGIAGARAGVELLLRFGSEAIEQRVLSLSGDLIDGLEERGIAVATPADPLRRGGVVAFSSDRPEALAAFLRDRKIDVWGYAAEARMRADPHLYNNADDVHRLMEGIDDFARTPP
jgi:selenocysteine lyase/cysteine desulfurase